MLNLGLAHLNAKSKGLPGHISLVSSLPYTFFSLSERRALNY